MRRMRRRRSSSSSSIGRSRRSSYRRVIKRGWRIIPRDFGIIVESADRIESTGIVIEIRIVVPFVKTNKRIERRRFGKRRRRRGRRRRGRNVSFRMRNSRTNGIRTFPSGFQAESFSTNFKVRAMVHPLDVRFHIGSTFRVRIAQHGAHREQNCADSLYGTPFFIERFLLIESVNFGRMQDGDADVAIGIDVGMPEFRDKFERRRLLRIVFGKCHF